MRRRTVLVALVLLAMTAALELVGDLLLRANVPPESDWTALAEHVRSKWQERDVVIARTEWAEPLVREYLGDLMPLEMVGRSDLLGYVRAWSVSVGGSVAEDDRKVLETREFGGLSLQLTELPEQGNVVLDLVDAFPRAQVFAGKALCSHQRSRPSGGGLGRGPMRPAEYWSCPGEREWIGRTTIEDLDYEPRRCVWQRASTQNPTRVTFTAVGPAKRLVVHAGHYLRDERKLDSPPVTLNVYVGGSLAGQMTHRDGDGWKRFEVALDPKQPVTVSFEPVAVGRNQNFCWSAKALQ